MMTPTEIDAWALRVIEHVVDGQDVEDVKVELKTKWPDDPAWAARRIAAHANAARGEPILWLIGVDEKAGPVPGAERQELADWWPSVESLFNGPPPNPIAVKVYHEDKTVTALYFETARRPYVVKNPNHGKPGGGPVELEVPWRVLNKTRSATHSDLVKLLAPMQHAPRFEFVQASLNLQRRTDLYKDDNLVIDGYVEGTNLELLFISFHRCRVFLRPSGSQEWMLCGPVQFDSSGIGGGPGRGPSEYVKCSGNDARIDGAGMVRVVARHIPRSESLPDVERVELRLDLQPSGMESASSFTATVVPSQVLPGLQARWELERPTSPS